MPLRGLTGEQLFDSLAMATGYRDSGSSDDLISGLLGGNRSARSDFLTKFALSERPTEAQTSILHALTLMNGKVTVVNANSLICGSQVCAPVVGNVLVYGDRHHLTGPYSKSTAPYLEALLLAANQTLDR